MGLRWRRRDRGGAVAVTSQLTISWLSLPIIGNMTALFENVPPRREHQARYQEHGGEGEDDELDVDPPDRA